MGETELPSHQDAMSVIAYAIDIKFKCCQCGHIVENNALSEAERTQDGQLKHRLSFLSWTMSDISARPEGRQRQVHGEPCQVMYRPDFLCRKCFKTVWQSKEHSQRAMSSRSTAMSSKQRPPQLHKIAKAMMQNQRYAVSDLPE